MPAFWKSLRRWVIVSVVGEGGHLNIYYVIPHCLPLSPLKLVCLREPPRVWPSEFYSLQRINLRLLPELEEPQGRDLSRLPPLSAGTYPPPTSRDVQLQRPEPFWRFCEELLLGLPSWQMTHLSWSANWLPHVHLLSSFQYFNVVISTRFVLVSLCLSTIPLLLC